MKASLLRGFFYLFCGLNSPGGEHLFFEPDLQNHLLPLCCARRVALSRAVTLMIVFSDLDFFAPLCLVNSGMPVIRFTFWHGYCRVRNSYLF